jgi:hypothetical protein
LDAQHLVDLLKIARHADARRTGNRGGSIMTVEIFGVQTVQAVATVLLAAIVLLGAVLLAVVTIVEGASGLVAITLSRAAARPSTQPDSFRPPRWRPSASLPSRAPPQSIHRPERTILDRDEG